MAKHVDVRVENHGSIMLFIVLTPAAVEWVAENVPTEGWQWLGQRSFAVEPRYADNLIAGMEDAGLIVS